MGRRNSGAGRRKSSGAARMSLMEGGTTEDDRFEDEDSGGKYKKRSMLRGRVSAQCCLVCVATIMVCFTLLLSITRTKFVTAAASGANSLSASEARGMPTKAEGGVTFDRASADVLALCAAHDNPDDCDALVSLARAAGSTSWKHATGWLSGSSVCTWYGVDCRAGRVVEIDLGSNHLVGTIPSALRKVQKLVTLNLDNNKLVGSLPPNALHLPRLRRLNLGYNKLVGTVPTDLGRAAPKLTHVFLNFNLFEGPTPWLGELSHLRSAYLCGNRLDGTVPDLHALHDLENIDLNHNRYSGDHPSLAELAMLKYVDFSNNHLHGTVPDLKGHPELQYLLLNNNELTGTLPSLGDCPALHSVDMSNNKLSGQLPIYSLPQLVFIDLGNNALHGDVQLLPQPFNAPKISYIGLANNGFGGQFWAGAGLPMPALRGFDVSGNAFTSLRTDICKLMPKVFQVSKTRAAKGKLGCHTGGNSLANNPSGCASVPQCVKDHCNTPCDANANQRVQEN